MTPILRPTALAVLLAASIPAIAAAQDTSPGALIRRIENLERANADLERRVRALESVIKSEPLRSQPVPDSTKWLDLANWRRLRVGMSMKEVRALLGEPERIEGGAFTYWRWTDANVVFFSGKVNGWSEPKR